MFEVGAIVLDHVVNDAGDIQHQAAVVEMNAFSGPWTDKEATEAVALYLSVWPAVELEMAGDAFNVHLRT